ncbi:MAG: MFS transporter [Rhodobacteraceae bacterium]|nr:MFS transporter [Paracoccaceae bacterium]
MIFSGLILAMTLAALDQSIVNTALPRMARDPDGLAHLSWVVTAFLLSSTIATPIWCTLSDMFGRRTFLMICILLFVAASALCGVAQSMCQLIAFRFLQGIGGGGPMTPSQTVIADVVTPPRAHALPGLLHRRLRLLERRWPADRRRAEPGAGGFHAAQLDLRRAAVLGRRTAQAVHGIALGATGLSLLALLAVNQAGIPWLLRALAVLGLGMGVAMPNTTAIVQNAVPRPWPGIATSSMSFIRSLGVAVPGGVVSGLPGARLDRLASEIDVQPVTDGGMAVIGTLSPELQPGIAEAFRQSIAVSFGIGGAVTGFAFLLAMSLRGTTFSESSTGTSVEEPA